MALTLKHQRRSKRKIQAHCCIFRHVDVYLWRYRLIIRKIQWYPRVCVSNLVLGKSYNYRQFSFFENISLKHYSRGISVCSWRIRWHEKKWYVSYLLRRYADNIEKSIINWASSLWSYGEGAYKVSLVKVLLWRLLQQHDYRRVDKTETLRIIFYASDRSWSNLLQVEDISFWRHWSRRQEKWFILVRYLHQLVGEANPLRSYSFAKVRCKRRCLQRLLVFLRRLLEKEWRVL